MHPLGVDRYALSSKLRSQLSSQWRSFRSDSPESLAATSYKPSGRTTGRPIAVPVPNWSNSWLALPPLMMMALSLRCLILDGPLYLHIVRLRGREIPRRQA